MKSIQKETTSAVKNEPFQFPQNSVSWAQKYMGSFW